MTNKITLYENINKEIYGINKNFLWVNSSVHLLTKKLINLRKGLELKQKLF